MATIRQRRQANGAIRYTAIVRLRKGRVLLHQEYKTFKHLAAAQSWARRREVELESPATLLRKQHAAVTLGELIRWYIDSVQAISKWQRSKQTHLQYLERHEIAKRPCAQPASGRHGPGHGAQRFSQRAKAPPAIPPSASQTRSRSDRHSCALPYQQESHQDVADGAHHSRNESVLKDLRVTRCDGQQGARSARRSPASLFPCLERSSRNAKNVRKLLLRESGAHSRLKHLRHLDMMYACRLPCLHLPHSGQ